MPKCMSRWDSTGYLRWCMTEGKVPAILQAQLGAGDGTHRWWWCASLSPFSLPFGSFTHVTTRRPGFAWCVLRPHGAPFISGILEDLLSPASTLGIYIHIYIRISLSDGTCIYTRSTDRPERSRRNSVALCVAKCLPLGAMPHPCPTIPRRIMTTGTAARAVRSSRARPKMETTKASSLASSPE